MSVTAATPCQPHQQWSTDQQRLIHLEHFSDHTSRVLGWSLSLQDAFFRIRSCLPSWGISLSHEFAKGIMMEATIRNVAVHNSENCEQIDRDSGGIEGRKWCPIGPKVRCLTSLRPFPKVALCFWSDYALIWALGDRWTLLEDQM